VSDDTTKLLNACVEYRAMVDKLEAENAALRELTSTLGAPNHINIPVEKWRELREDKERLDWLGNLITIDGWDPRKKRLVELTHPIRVSIDAARKEAQP